MISDLQIFENVYARLETGLPEYYTYHNRHHTEFIVKVSRILARKAGLDDDASRLVSYGALYHDTGFLLGLENHEEKGCYIARQDLQAFGLSENHIDQICGMIMATRIPQRPTTLLEKIVADADLYYLGTSRYEVFSTRLYQEMKHFKPSLSDAEWLKIQINFLTAHSYHTPYAQSKLAPVKRQHLEQLQSTQAQTNRMER